MCTSILTTIKAEWKFACSITVLAMIQLSNHLFCSSKQCLIQQNSFFNWEAICNVSHIIASNDLSCLPFNRIKNHMTRWQTPKKCVCWGGGCCPISTKLWRSVCKPICLSVSLPTDWYFWVSDVTPFPDCPFKVNNPEQSRALPVFYMHLSFV